MLASCPASTCRRAQGSEEASKQLLFAGVAACGSKPYTSKACQLQQEVLDGASLEEVEDILVKLLQHGQILAPGSG